MEGLIAVIVKQLLLQLDVIPKEVIKICNQHRRIGTRISLCKGEKLLRLACSAFNRVYICINALDELQERARLLDSLRKASSSARLFFTGRDYITTTMKGHFEIAIMLQVKANENDIRNLIRTKIAKSGKEEPNLIDKGLQQEITDQIVARSVRK